MKHIMLIIITMILFTSCTKKDETIKIGLVVGTSGKYSSLGNSISDGVLLAFNEINYTINGKPVEIIQKDDKQDKKTNQKVIKDLLNNDIKLIIGNATSSMTKVSLDIINQKKDILLFSPTASSSEFSQKDDNFLRINGGDPRIVLGEFIKFIKINHFKNIIIIGDNKNKTFLNTYTKILPKYLKNENILSKKMYYINSNLSLKTIITKVDQYNVYDKIDLIIIVANSIDTATTIQYLRQHNINNNIICTGWANDKGFFENIGKYSDGIYFSTSLEKNEKTKQYKIFEKSFLKAYGKKPKKFNIKGYKTAQILIEALKQSNDIKNLKQIILKQKVFDTITGKVTFNKYGDIQYKESILKLQNNKFIRVFNE